MYHKVGAVDRFLNVETDSFRTHISFMKKRGYECQTFSQICHSIQSGKPQRKQAFAVTFDDAYECVFENAYPVLQDLGAVATTFVVSSVVGKTNIWDRVEGHEELQVMDWSQIQTVLGSGWEIGGHTQKHPHLDALARDEALEDIGAGKREIEAKLGITLDTFCYPFGHFNGETPGIVQELGFVGACTTKSGVASLTSDPYLVPRVKLSYSDKLAGLIYKLYLRPLLPNARKNRRDHNPPKGT